MFSTPPNIFRLHILIKQTKPTALTTMHVWKITSSKKQVLITYKTRAHAQLYTSGKPNLPTCIGVNCDRRTDIPSHRTRAPV